MVDGIKMSIAFQLIQLVILFSQFGASKQFFHTEKDTRMEMFPKFVDDLCKYAGTQDIHFVLDGEPDFSLRHMVKSKEPMIKTGFSIFDTYDTLVNDLNRYELTSVLVIVYSKSENFTIFLINWMETEDRLTGDIYWLIQKPRNLKLFRRFSISPSSKLFTFHYDTKKYSPTVWLGYLHSNYQHRNVLLTHKPLGMWNEKQRLRVKKSFNRCCYDLKGYPINIIYCKESEPAVTVRQISNNTWNITGVIGDIVSLIFQDMGVRLYNKVYVQPQGIFGGLDENNLPFGVFKDLHEKKADIAVAGFAATPGRMKISDMTIGFIRTYVSAIYKEKPAGRTLLSFYFKSFSQSSWILIVSGSAAMLIIVTVIFKSCRPDIKSDILLMLWGAEISQSTFEDAFPKSVALNLCYVITMVLGLLLPSFYSSRLMAERAANIHNSRFNTLMDIAMDEEYFPIVWRNGAFQQILKDSTNTEYQELWHRMKTDLIKHTAQDRKEMLHKIQEQSAVYIGPNTVLADLQNMDPELTIMDNAYFHNYLVFALQKRSPLTSMVNDKIAEFLQKGVILRIRRSYLVQKKKPEKAQPREVHLQEFILLIVILALAILSSLIFHAVEVFTHGMKNKRK